VWPLCEKYAINKTSLALSFILSYQEISTVIPGIRTARHAAENTQGIIQLSLEDVGLLETAYSKYFSEVVDKMELQG
jgi:aryl-alcohol dehydrogenase-like predicted oxidoreductase